MHYRKNACNPNEQTMAPSANDNPPTVSETAISEHQKARILAEALPNILQHDGQTVVIKFGGHAMGEAALSDAFAQDIVYLKQSGVNPIVVHGGGPQIAAMLKKLEIKSEFVNGLRVTDKPTVEVVEMVLAGAINKEIVSAINRQGGKAVGICGKDAKLMVARKITEMPDPESNLMKAVDIGYVGEPTKVNPHIVDVISKSDLIPVVAPIGITENGETLNINADTFASALAAATGAKRLLLLTDVAGVLDGDGQPARRTHGRRGARADPKRHHHRRYDPKDRRLHRGRGKRCRGRRHHKWDGAALCPARIVDRARGRDNAARRRTQG